ncbi:MAG: M23 family metallopeptidase [Anaerolineaceae bacterium]|nr:M23 family metallopeptidase [Anaerolineaceae bacterium]
MLIKHHLFIRVTISIGLLILLFLTAPFLYAQEVPLNHAGFPAVNPPAELPDEPPFILPLAEPPGPDTWLLGQAYGNTTGAFVQRRVFYQAGQGIHFGLDFSAECGTEVVAIGDGIVSEVDGRHGSLPHNLVIDHPNGYSSLYGHLLEKPDLPPGQEVTQGEVIALSGDSFGTCHSAPHLHLEIRDNFHWRAFNPVPLIKADWDNLALVGSFSNGFQRDLLEPRRWQTIKDQPTITFGGELLNEYSLTWPPETGGR